MAQTFLLSPVNSDLTGGSDFTKQLTPAGETEGTTSINISCAFGTTEVNYAFTPVGIPGTNGTSTGVFTVEVRIGATGDTAYFIRPTLSRVNAAGTVQAGPISPAEAEATCAANTTRTFTFTNPTLGTWAAGDRLRVGYSFRSSKTMNPAGSVDVVTATTDTEVITPFTESGNPKTATDTQALTATDLASGQAGGDTIASETFTASTNDTLESLSGWSMESGGTSAVIASNRVRSGGNAEYSHSAAPVTAEYDVRGDVYAASQVTTSWAAMSGRIAGTGGTFDNYTAWMTYATGGVGELELSKTVNGVYTNLGEVNPAAAAVVAVGQSKRLQLQIRDATKRIVVDGEVYISSTDNANTVAGKAGLSFSAPADGNTTGYHVDNWIAQDVGTGGGGESKDAPDSQALTATDTATLAATAAAADTQALTATDAATVAVAKEAPDTQALTATDAAAAAAAVTAADTQALTAADSASMTYAVTVADTQALTATDAATLDTSEQKPAPDTQALTVVETVSVAVAVTAADSQALTATDLAVMTYAPTAADTQALTATDAATVVIQKVATDSQALTAASAAALAAAFTVADTQALTIVDSAVVPQTHLRAILMIG
jgi:hypothetical protein